ncbi:vitelline membrane outer layer protein 1-like [Paroedura picta]|uniref:vitelline membrane outer layer protein 1-like n=1 Tax=Paroedura picta TaxID=143630 RepID=UPI0040577491
MVPNGILNGGWGNKQFCPKGYARSFSLKVEPYQGLLSDDTSLNAIRLLCSDGSSISSSEGPFGWWSGFRSCKKGFLNSFSLRVTQPKGALDATGANNIKFICTDETELEGNGHDWGSYGQWSPKCKQGGICGIQTKLQVIGGHYFVDRTTLNDETFMAREKVLVDCRLVLLEGDLITWLPGRLMCR